VRYAVLVLVALVSSALVSGAVAPPAAAQSGTEPAPFPSAEAVALERAIQEKQDRGFALFMAGDFRKALPLYEQARDMALEGFGPDSGLYAANAEFAARARELAGDVQGAIAVYESLLPVHEKVFGPRSGEMSGLLNVLAGAKRALGQYREALALLDRSMPIARELFGPRSPDVGNILGQQAQIYVDLEDFAAAEQTYRESLEIVVAGSGPDDLGANVQRVGLALALGNQGKYEEALAVAEEAMASIERTVGLHHLGAAAVLQLRANFLKDLGRLSEAEAAYQQIIANLEASVGSDHSVMATPLSNLALLYQQQGRAAEALPLARRALAIVEATLPANHPNIGLAVSVLGGVMEQLDRFDEAEAAYRRQIEIFRSRFGDTSSGLGGAHDNLGRVLIDRQRYEEAERHLMEGLAVRERVFGRAHPMVAYSLQNLAFLYRSTGRLADALPLVERTIDMQQALLGPDHPDLANSYGNLAWTHHGLGNHARALDLVREASRLQADRLRLPDNGTGHRAGHMAERRSRRWVFQNHIRVLIDAANAGAGPPLSSAALHDELLRTAQLAVGAEAARAIARMASRFAAGDDRLAGLIREQQDIRDRMDRLNEQLVAEATKAESTRNERRQQTWRRDLAALQARAQEIGSTVRTALPHIADLTDPRPVDLQSLRELLEPGEAVLHYVFGPHVSHVVVVTPESSGFARLLITQDQLADAVTELRRHLDPTAFDQDGPPPFPADTAATLYAALIEPVASLLQNTRHLLFIPDGALQSLPIGVLLSDEPERSPVAGAKALRDLPWLVRRYAVTVLPSVSSLQALRQLARTSAAPEPFIGIGDPLLLDHPSGRVSPATRACPTAEPVQVADMGAGDWVVTERGARAGIGALYRGGRADLCRIGQLASLPETAAELETMQRVMGGGTLLLREDATEGHLRGDAGLGRARVVAFATHGVLSGELTGLAEPALILTPPAEATAIDDGLLTASEIASSLELDADWVIMSACNTAGPDGRPGAEGLSGLAQAFFHAGARSLFVSHWAVPSLSTAELTTRMLATLAEDGSIGRSEAHRRAMLSLVADPDHPEWAHPTFWAPFIVVGDGGTRHR